MRRFFIACIAACGLLLALEGGWLPLCRKGAGRGFAADEPAAQEQPGQRAADAGEEIAGEAGDDKEQEGQEEDEDEDEGDEDEIVFLGRTYKLELSVQPREDQQPHWLLVATRRFGYEVEYGNDEEGMEFNLHGKLFPVAGREEALVVFATTLYLHGKEGHGRVQAGGSTVVKFGREQRVAALGEHSLSVKLTAVEARTQRRLEPPPDREEVF